MKIQKRLCVRDWFIEAKNGDRLDLKRGKEYTTSAKVGPDQTVMVFTKFWVRVPIDIFYERGDYTDWRDLIGVV